MLRELTATEILAREKAINEGVVIVWRESSLNKSLKYTLFQVYLINGLCFFEDSDLMMCCTGICVEV